MPDWKALLQQHGPQLVLGLLAGKTGGLPGATAFNQGQAQHDAQQEQLARQQQQDAQQAEYHQAQMGNLQADNARADQQAQQQQLQHALALIDAATKQQGETATDPAQAENAIMQRANTAANLYHLPADALTGMVPNMGPVISTRKKKQVEELYSRAEKLYGPEAMANDSISIDTGELMGGPKKPSELRTVFAPAAQDQTGQPAKPYIKPAAGSDVNAGSFEDYVLRYAAQKKVDPKALTPQDILLARKAYSAADNTPKAGDEPIAPDDVDGAAGAILAGRMAPSQLSLVGGMGNRGVKFKQAVVASVNKKDPTFNWQQAEAGYQFGKNTGTQNTVRYMESVQESMPRVLASAQQLANGNVRAVNALVNAGKNQFNNVDLKAFQTDVLLVGDEVAKILQGGGTGNGTSDAKLRQASQILSSTDSPAAIATALNEVNTLLGFRKASLVKGTFLDKGTPQSGPAVGEQRLINGQLATWDGKGWKAK